MRYIPTYGDYRQLGFGAFCGGSVETRDHCPSKVFLDDPYPENLPVVPACRRCNQGFSADEEYLACLLTCVVSGCTHPDFIKREKIARILMDKPKLRARIEGACTVSASETVFTIEDERVTAVVTKLAQGHALPELHEPCLTRPVHVSFKPLMEMSNSEREEFEAPTASSIDVWPEVGSRALQRLLVDNNDLYSGWLEVQPRRYRYRATVANGIDIRIVIHEYLSAIVRWE